MNEDQKKLDALTNQQVTISLGGKSYTARRATLYDVGVMNRKKAELTNAGDMGNLDLDVTMYLLWSLINEYHKEVESPEQLAKSIPFENISDITDALEAVGFKVPQSLKEKMKETGA